VVGWVGVEETVAGENFPKRKIEKKKFCGIIMGWLGRLRDIGTVVVRGGEDDGIPNWFVEMLRRKLGSSSGQASRVDGYVLEVGGVCLGISFCENT